MSLASQVGTAAGVLAAAGAAVSLWLGAERYAGPSRRAYRWFAVASVLWGAGVIAGQVLAPPVGRRRSRSRSVTCPRFLRCWSWRQVLRGSGRRDRGTLA